MRNLHVSVTADHSGVILEYPREYQTPIRVTKTKKEQPKEENRRFSKENTTEEAAESIKEMASKRIKEKIKMQNL